MGLKIKIGDSVKVISNGYQYTTYSEKAIELGADVSAYIRNCFRNGLTVNHGRARRDRKCKWIFDNDVGNGDICEVINFDDRNHVLIERIYDGRQFLMDPDGFEYYGSHAMFGDKDFLI